MRITNYLDFINESKLEILLEANIKYTSNFNKILSKIKSNISTNLIELQGKDVDVTTNYIDTSDKNDVIIFIPDNKVKEVETDFIVNNGETYPSLGDIAFNKGMMTLNGNANNGDIIISKRELNLEEISSLHYSSNWVNWLKNNKMFIIKAKNSNGNEYECIANNKAIDITKKIEGPKSELKIGRFVRRILDKSGIKVTDKEIEDFVNLYKARVDIEKDAFRNIEVVSGEDIRRCYNDKYYDSPESGQLWSSCMRYDRCSGYFDIYCENTKQVSMVILKNEDTGRIKGRAILWTDVEGRKFMDRVYTIKDSDVSLFIEYAKKNQWIYKSQQENDADTKLMLGEEVLDNNSITVELEKGGTYNQYPYMDTLKFLKKDGTITNSDRGYQHHDYRLEETNGGNGDCDNCGGSGTSECSNCGGSGVNSCYDCDGTGNVGCSACDSDGFTISDNGEKTTCDYCKGDGTKTCGDCHGDGDLPCEECGGDGRYDCPDCN